MISSSALRLSRRPRCLSIGCCVPVIRPSNHFNWPNWNELTANLADCVCLPTSQHSARDYESSTRLGGYIGPVTVEYTEVYLATVLVLYLFFIPQREAHSGSIYLWPIRLRSNVTPLLTVNTCSTDKHRDVLHPSCKCVNGWVALSCLIDPCGLRHNNTFNLRETLLTAHFSNATNLCFN